MSGSQSPHSGRQRWRREGTKPAASVDDLECHGRQDFYYTMRSTGLYSWDSCSVLAVVLQSGKAAAVHLFLTLLRIDPTDENHRCPGRSDKQKVMTMADQPVCCYLLDQEVGCIGC